MYVELYSQAKEERFVENVKSAQNVCVCHSILLCFRAAVSLRAAVIAVMACNRLTWFAASMTLGKPHPILVTSSDLQGFVGISGPSRKRDVSTGSWRRSFERFLFFAPTGGAHQSTGGKAFLPVSDDDTSLATRFLSLLSDYYPDHAATMSRMASSTGTMQTLFRGLRAHASKANRASTGSLTF